MGTTTLLLVAVAGICAGAVNTAAGGGTLLAYPALLAAGLTPAAANMTSLIGLVPGYVSGAWAYRVELAQQRPTLVRLLPTAVLGGIGGGILLRTTPSEVFERAVPFLILASTLLLLAQPRITRIINARPSTDWGTVPAHGAALAAGVYGVYFSAGLGVLLLALLGLTVVGDLQLLNGLKTGVSLVIILAGATVYIGSPQIDWSMIGVMLPCSALGGLLGGRLARSLSATVLRAVVCVLGVVLALALLLAS